MGNLDKVVEFFTGVSPSDTDVIHLLKKDHRTVEELFKGFEEAESNGEKKHLLGQIVSELKAHTFAEEKVVYTVLKEEDKGKTLEALEEHHAVDFLIAELEKMDGSEEVAKAKVKVLSEMVKHHIKEEEQTLLPMLKAMDVDLNAMGERFENSKKNFNAGKANEEKKPSESGSKMEKKPAAKKTAAKKSAAKKPAAKKSAAKKSIAKKTVAKKSTASKTKKKPALRSVKTKTAASTKRAKPASRKLRKAS